MAIINNLVTNTGIMDVFLTIAQAGEAPVGGTTLLQQIQNGGFTGYVILALSMLTVALIIIHFVSLRPDRLMPGPLVDELRNVLGKRDVNKALTIVQDPENDCFFSRVLERGLSRYTRGAFGPFEYRTTLEQAGGEEVSRLYRATDALGLIGAIAPMLGLLGTVLGMVGAFDTISNADSRPELLAGDISKALITTLMGLSLAIPAMAAFTFFRNKIDSQAAIVAAEIEELTIPLEDAQTQAIKQSKHGTAPKISRS